MIRAFSIFVAVVAPVVGLSMALSDPGEPPRVQVLFLGDDGHHRPRERVAEAHVPLFERGIQLEYTEDLTALAPSNLARFDAVVIYANHTRIEPEQEAALLGFVRGGGGLVALHCASYCFLNSPAYRRLVGGQFASHGTGVFGARIELPEHPVMAGSEPFECWDETYVHTEIGTDIEVLASRDRKQDEPGGSGAEPWTWVRDEGEGRVFYTASGHDARAWTNPGYIDLIARGIRWAAGQEAPGAPAPAPPFEYAANEAAVPDYASGDPAGAATEIQLPLSPEASLERAAFAPGLQGQLFASEPLLQGKPIHLAFGPRGRAWVLETVDYPNERTDGEGQDRLVILEDTDGDQRADRRTVFADGLSVPTSVAFARGGAVVTMAPDVLFLRDVDGDDVADEREVLFTGFGTADTHAGPSNLRLGPDGRLFGTVGYSGFRGRVGGKEHSFYQAIFAFEPDGSDLEVIASTTNNTWGLGFDESGSIFASTANGNPSVHAAIPLRHYAGAPGLSAGALATIAEHLELHPVTDRVRQVDFHGKYTAAAGHALYTARLLPERYWDRIAFVASPTGHTVGQLALDAQGADYVARDAWNLVASDDEWTAPIGAEVGPDGAVWVTDWYNYIVQHNPTPPGFETGAGNAYVTELRDKTRGRIWRIVPAGADVPLEERDLAAADIPALVRMLGDSNMGWRLHAQRALIDRGGSAAATALLESLEEAAPPVLHAIWTLRALARQTTFDEDTTLDVADALVRALRHPDWGVRRAALEGLPAADWARDTVLSVGLLEDPDPKVRVAALLALARMPASDSAGAAAFRVLVSGAAEEDRWLADAATIAGAAHGAGFLKALLADPIASAVEDEAATNAPNLVQNPSFEEGAGGAGSLADGWRARHYSGDAQSAVVEGIARTGRHSLRIASDSGTDTSVYTAVRLERGAQYVLEGWIKAEGLDADTGRGASFNVHELQGTAPARTPGVSGTGEWQRVAHEFKADGPTDLTINCLFGGWGQSKGVAYFDDVRVVRVQGPLLGGALGRALPVVIRAYASRGPKESVVSMLGLLADIPEPLADALLSGLAEGWPAGSTPEIEKADSAALNRLAGRLDEGTRARLAVLLSKWNVELGSVVDVAALVDQLALRVADVDASTEVRIAALERLVALGEEQVALRIAADALDPTADPALVAGLIRGVLSGASLGAGEGLLDAWSAMGPSARRTCVTMLLRREGWTKALLDRMVAGTIAPTALDEAQWTRVQQQFVGGPHGSLVAKARGVAADPDRDRVVQRFRGLLGQPADAGRGHAVYRDVCAKCHVAGGEGVAFGPSLDGIGERSPEELLVAILDPNRSVEGTYQLWNARTHDGLVLSGRLVAETSSSIELQDTDGSTHLVDREDLDILRSAGISLMPAGLEETTGEQGLLDLLEYLRSLH